MKIDVENFDEYSDVAHEDTVANKDVQTGKEQFVSPYNDVRERGDGSFPYVEITVKNTKSVLFSNLYISRDEHQNVHFYFSFDPLAYLREYSPYKEIYESIDVDNKEKYKKNIFIHKIEIWRERVKDKTKFQYHHNKFETNNEEFLVISSNQEENSLKEESSNDGFVKQIRFLDSSQYYFFSCSDKNIKNIHCGTYRYYVKMFIEDLTNKEKENISVIVNELLSSSSEEKVWTVKELNAIEKLEAAEMSFFSQEEQDRIKKILTQKDEKIRRYELLKYINEVVSKKQNAQDGTSSEKIKTLSIDKQGKINFIEHFFDEVYETNNLYATGYDFLNSFEKENIGGLKDIKIEYLKSILGLDLKLKNIFIDSKDYFISNVFSKKDFYNNLFAMLKNETKKDLLKDNLEDLISNNQILISQIKDMSSTVKNPSGYAENVSFSEKNIDILNSSIEEDFLDLKKFIIFDGNDMEEADLHGYNYFVNDLSSEVYYLSYVRNLKEPKWNKFVYNSILSMKGTFICKIEFKEYEKEKLNLPILNKYFVLSV